MPKTTKILVVETVNNNLGDPILADNNCYLIKKAFGDRPVELFRHRIRTQDPIQLKYVDAVFFAGGIIKTATERFWLFMSEIITKANELDLPVFLSSVGAEPYDGSDEAIALKKALNLPCVKGTSIRDDIDSFNNGWHTNPDIPVYTTYDPAVWCPYTYDIEPRIKAGEGAEKDTSKRGDAPLVGIGVVRYQLFSDYGHPEIDREYQLDFWKGVTERLEKRGYRWVLFTNGAGPDEEAAREVIEHIGHGEIVPAPLDGHDLVEKINQFDCVVAGRMHSNIIAYSLGIPCIGFVWNQKLRFWGEKIGHPERLIELENMNPDYVTDQLIKAEQEGIHEVYDYQYNGVYDAIKHFVDDWCHPKEHAHDHLNFAQKTVAVGLGAIYKRNPTSNTIDAFEYSRALGYKIFDLDVRYTSDNVLVCINKWTKATLRTLGVITEEEICRLTYEDFKGRKYYDRYPTLSFADFIQYLSKYSSEGYTIILDVGKPTTEERQQFFADIHKILSSANTGNTKFLFKVERDSDIRAIKQLDKKYELIFYLPPASSGLTAKQRDALYLCKRHRIKTIAMEADSYSRRIRKVLEKKRLHAYILSVDKVGSIIKFVSDKRIRFVGSFRYDVDYMDKLTKL